MRFGFPPGWYVCVEDPEDHSDIPQIHDGPHTTRAKASERKDAWELNDPACHYIFSVAYIDRTGRPVPPPADSR